MGSIDLVSIRVPNPYFEKDNNAYLVNTGELILIDTGIDTPEAFSRIQLAVESAGFKLEKISKIFLTHKHLDHFGLAGRIARLSGAQVYVHQDDYLDVTQFDQRHDLINSLYDQKMLDWGIPQNLIDMLSMRSRLVKLGSSVEATALSDHELIKLFGGEIRVIHTPGHTQGSVCYLLRNLLFTGDHLLPTYTPNIGATEVTATGMLKKYKASLAKIEKFASHRMLPGHGNEILNPKERIEEIMTHHEEREAKILEILDDDSRKSVYEIAQSLFGEMREHHVLLGAGEAAAHLESMIEDGKVKMSPDKLYLRA